MKYLKIFLIILIIFSIPCIVYAETDITFAFDHDGLDVDGFNLYQNDSNQHNMNPELIIWSTKDANLRTIELKNVKDGLNYWYLTAFDRFKNESPPSNIVSLYTDTTGPSAPGLKIISTKKTIRETITKIVEEIVNYF